MYSYDSKYLFTASVRRDGSSRFAEGYKYGVFPSVSAGWNIHHEEFFSELTDVVNSFKVRGSWGVLGNQEIGNYPTLNSVDQGMNYVQGGSWWHGTIPAGYASPIDLSWEETKTTNIGFDFGLFKNKLHGVVDIYNKKTEGVLLGVPFPISIGKNGSPTLNAGVVENKGVEISLNHPGRIGKVDYRFGLNFTKVNNEMTDITIGSGNQEFGGISKAKIGYPIGSFFLVKTDGIFNSAAEVQAHSKDGQLIQPNTQPGDIRFVDFSGDGQINNDDQQYVGSPFPDFSVGFNGSFEWNNFDANFFIDGVFGNKIYSKQRFWLEKMVEVVNFSTDVLDAWTENNHSDFPRFTFSDPNSNNRESDRWLENGSYVRLKRVELGYTFPRSIISELGVESLRVYCSGENLLTLTDYSGFNPDIGGGALSRGIDNSTIHPLSRTFLIGLNLKF